MGQFWLGVLIIAIAAALGWWGTQMASDGWKNWKHPALSSGISLPNQGDKSGGSLNRDVKDIYKLMVSSNMRFKYPGQLLYLYNSQLGSTISPVSVALFVEIVNSKSSISRVYSLETRAFMRYDEGGRTQINPQSSGGYQFSYIPSGNIVKAWRTLHSVGFLHDQVYFVTNNDWTKCKRIDFSKNSFELEARNRQLQPGESLKGWFFMN